MSTTEQVLALRAKTPTIKAATIAKKLGVSRERVRQILKGAGLATSVPLAPGHLRTEFKCWWNMIDRCNNPDSADFHHYGGRGITVCARWQSSFANFMADMGKRPSRYHSIERRNNARGYSPSNCAWATKTEQVRNTRTSKLTERQVMDIRAKYIAGAKQVDLAAEFDISQTWVSRIVRGEVWQ